MAENSIETLIRFFKSLVDDLQELVFSCKNFDKAYEINAYCDQVECQITLTYDSAIERLNNLKKESLEEVSGYRKALLESLDGPLYQASDAILEAQFRCDKTIFNFIDEQMILKEEKLMKFLQYADSDNIDSEGLTNRLEDVESAIGDMKLLKETLMISCLRGRCVKFKENSIFLIEDDPIGKLEYRKEIKQLPITIETNHYKYSLINGTYRVNAAEFLNPNTLVAVSSDNMIRTWNVFSGVLLTETPCLETAFSLSVYEHMNLITGNIRGQILLWNMPKLLLGTWDAHTSKVHSLKVFKKEYLSSVSEDGTIIIWNIFLETLKILYKIEGLGLTKSPLGILSNNYIATCNYSESNSIFRVFNSSNKVMVQMMETALPCVESLLVLPDDTVVLAAGDGTIKIFDIVTKSVLRTLSKTHIHDQTGAPSLHLVPVPGCFFLTDQPRRSYEKWLEKSSSSSASESDDSDKDSIHAWDPNSGLIISKFSFENYSSILSVQSINRFQIMLIILDNQENVGRVSLKWYGNDVFDEVNIPEKLYRV